MGDALDTFICTGLVANAAGNLYALADEMWMFTQASSSNALTALMHSANNASVTGSPTFTSNSGYVGASGSNYLTSPFNLSTSTTNYTQTDASMFFWTNTSFGSGTDYGEPVGTSSDNYAVIYPHYSDNTYYFNPNSATNQGNRSSGGFNFMGWVVFNSSGGNSYVNTTFASFTEANSALPNEHLLFLQSNAITNPFIANLGFVSVGGNYSNAQEAALCHAVNVYMTSVAGTASGIC